MLKTFFVFLLNASLLTACPFASGARRIQKVSPFSLERASASKKEVYNQFKEAYALSLFYLQKDLEQAHLSLEEELQKCESFLKHTKCSGVLSLYQSLQALQSPSTENYTLFNAHLRKALTQLNSTSPFYTVAQKISELSFKVNLNKSQLGYSYFYSVIPELYKQIDPALFNVRKFHLEMKQVSSFTYLPALVHYLERKLHMLPWMNWDGAQFSVRSKLAEYHVADQTISILRMGCPTLRKLFHTEIDPLFLGFLSQLKLEHKKHLYINNQHAVPSSTEYAESQLLISLSENPNYQNVFYMVTLPYNSEFYQQNNLGLVQASRFQETFIHHIKSNTEGFWFPKDLVSDQYIKELEELFHFIHTHYFESQEFLEPLQRREFIDIAYAYLAEDLIQRLKVQSVNWTCKHGIDRAMSAVATFDALLQSKSAKPFNFRNTLYIAYWPALAHYHRTPITLRVVRMLSALRRLIETPNTLEQTFDHSASALCGLDES